MLTLSEKPQSIFKVTLDAVKLLFTSLSKVWYWQILFMLPVSTFYLSGLFLKQTTPFYIQGIILFCNLIAALIMVFGYLFVLNHMNDVAQTGETRIAHSFHVASRKLIRVIFTSLILGVALTSVLLLILSLSVIDSLAIYIYIITVCIALCLFIYLNFFVPFILFDDLSGFQSVKSSFKLVKGHWWRTFSVKLLASLLLICAILLLALIIRLLLLIPPLSHWANLIPQNYHLIVSLFGGFVLNFFFMLFSMSILLMLFYDLKTRKKQETEKQMEILREHKAESKKGD